MTVLSKRLLKPRIVTCGGFAVSPPAAGAISDVSAMAGGALIAPRLRGGRDRSPSERLQIFAYVDLLRHDTDVVAEICEGLQVVDLLGRHVPDQTFFRDSQKLKPILGSSFLG